MRLGRNLSEYKTNPPHVKAARMLQEQGIDIGVGDLVEYVITRSGVKPLQLASIEDVDKSKYVKYLRSMTEQILDAFDMSFDEIVGKPRQTSLEAWCMKIWSMKDELEV